MRIFIALKFSLISLILLAIVGCYLIPVVSQRKEPALSSRDKVTYEKQGIQVHIFLKNSGETWGELYAVKPDYLLVRQGSITRTVTPVAIKDIKFIDLDREPQIGVGICIGGISGACLSYALGGPYEGNNLISADVQLGFTILSGAFLGGMVGYIVSLIAAESDKRIILNIMSEAEIQIVLKKLRRKARVPDYK